MLLRNTAERYGAVSKCLHWLIAVLMIGLIWLGGYMVGLTYYDPWYNGALSTHKALGMLALALGVVKLLWSLAAGLPGYVATLRQWQRWAAFAAHLMLFAAMIVLPATGYLISTSAGDPVAFFGWFDIPALVPLSERDRDLAIALHYYTAYATAALAAVHALAALKHQFINRDGTLTRMLWR